MPPGKFDLSVLLTFWPPGGRFIDFSGLKPFGYTSCFPGQFGWLVKDQKPRLFTLDLHVGKRRQEDQAKGKYVRSYL